MTFITNSPAARPLARVRDPSSLATVPARLADHVSDIAVRWKHHLTSNVPDTFSGTSADAILYSAVELSFAFNCKRPKWTDVRITTGPYKWCQ